VIRAGLRRFAGLLIVVSTATAAVSLVIGLAVGSSASRSISVGFYLLGSFLLLAGFFVGNRGPVRSTGDPGVPIVGPLLRNRMLRWATAEEQQESLNMSLIFVAIGFVLIFLGVLADTRYALY
jgi:hypothetical protein